MLQALPAKKEPSKVVSFKEWAADLEAVPKAEQKFFVYETLKPKQMLPIFGMYFFPKIVKTTIPKCHYELIEHLTSRKDSAIIFPRGFAKTSWEKIDTLHDIVYGLEPVILYISTTLTDAGFHFESMKIELENNELLREVYGDLVPPDSVMSHKWTNKHFETTNGVNVVARGAGKGRGVNIKNQRPSKIICDDIETDEAVRSPDQRKKLQYWLYHVVIPSKDSERGFIKVIGTVLAKTCLLLRFYKAHGGLFRKAIEDGKSIWPEYWPLEKLYQVRDGYIDEEGNRVQGIGSRAFSQEFLNTPINEDTARIKEEWLEKSYYDVIPNAERLQVVIMFDPQAGEKEGSDFYGLAVVGWRKKDVHRYVLQVSRGRASQIDQAALVVRTYQQFKQRCSVVGIEKVLSQVAVYQLILDWKARKIDLPNVDNENRNIPLIAVSPEGKDKVARLEMHEAAFERGEIHLHFTMKDFAERIVAFPDVENDDDIDSLVYSLTYSYKSSPSLDDTGIKGDTIAGNLHKQDF